MSDTTTESGYTLTTTPTFTEITEMLRARLVELDTERARVHDALQIMTNGSGATRSTTPAPTPSAPADTGNGTHTRRTKRKIVVQPPGLKLRERLVPMLRTRGPLTTDDIVSALYEEGWTTSSANPRNVVYMLLTKHPAFKKTADNTWTITRKAEG